MQSLAEVKAGSTINVLHHGRDSMIICRDDIRLATGKEVAERIKV
ncbi:hypothetical protein [Clostridium sp. AM58-1XD]|nr:hypothetical protein [Clostridium sp. AM58-1XD]